jgi:hypothetical protein
MLGIAVSCHAAECTQDSLSDRQRPPSCDQGLDSLFWRTFACNGSCRMYAKLPLRLLRGRHCALPVRRRQIRALPCRATMSTMPQAPTESSAGEVEALRQQIAALQVRGCCSQSTLVEINAQPCMVSRMNNAR